MIKHDYADRPRHKVRSSRVDFMAMAFVFVLCCVEFF